MTILKYLFKFTQSSDNVLFLENVIFVKIWPNEVIVHYFEHHGHGCLSA